MANSVPNCLPSLCRPVAVPGIHRAEFSPATGEAPRVCIWNWKTGPEQTTVLISSAGYRHNRSPGRLSNMEGWTEMKGREEKKKRGGRRDGCN